MAKIVAVHGIGQQFSGDAIIHREWWPALLGGLHLIGRDLEDERELTCAFYRHLFRKPGTLAGGDSYRAEDVGPAEAELLNLLWQAAVKVEPQVVPSPSSYAEGETLARTPQVIQRALSAVPRSSFWANIAQLALIGDLKQVVLYMNDRDVREKVLEIVVEKITPDTRVVIGHSLGSVVAYEALCRKPENVVSFVSLGCLSNKLSQAEAAKLFQEAGLPISLRTLQNWEIGHRTPTALAAYALVEFLEKNPRVQKPVRNKK